MFTLFTSYDCGTSYQEEHRIEDIDELDLVTKQLDKDMIYWYVEKDGEATNMVCGIHRDISSFMEKLNK
ncbi:hypothetical protein KAR91_34580 [Candidatus Pacearchaeota archaeon]|nr:hypothetical protein [Candidatus Pacearchaeota archaeon]